jgi:hypothetical protein
LAVIRQLKPVGRKVFIKASVFGTWRIRVSYKINVALGQPNILCSSGKAKCFG